MNKNEVLRLAIEAGASMRHIAEFSGKTTDYIFRDEALERFAALLATPQAQPSEQDVIVDGLARAVETLKDAGFWSPCSGCYETEDGHPVGKYAYSEALGCALGSGCHECGGLGAVWDDTDYSDMADTATPAADQAQPTEQAVSELTETGRMIWEAEKAFAARYKVVSPAVSAAQREKIEAAIKHTEYKYFGDYEFSKSDHIAVDTLVEAARSLLSQAVAPAVSQDIKKTRK